MTQTTFKNPTRSFSQTPFLHIAAILTALLICPLVSSAATFDIVNLDDGTGVGFDDPTAVAPVGGNPGTTLGEQRLNAFEEAGRIWGAVLRSDVVIVVEATFDPNFDPANPLNCDQNTVTLGAAGPATAAHATGLFPYDDTLYPAALASSLYGQDVSTSKPDIFANFNGDYDGATCFPNESFYYGFDGLPPGDDNDFLTVLLHELGHGLGFLTYTDKATGALAEDDEGNSYHDVWNHFLYDETLDKTWFELTDAQRKASATRDGELTWSGGNVTAENGTLSNGVHLSGRVQMYAPATLESGSSVSHFEKTVDPDSLMEPVYTTVINDPNLTVALFQDIGWNTYDVCAWGCPYADLSSAIQAASPGATLTIGPGGYTLGEITSTDSQYTLRGDDPATTILESDGSDRLFKIEGSMADVEFEGLTLRGGSISNGAGGCMVAREGAKVTLTNSVVESCTAPGGGGLAVRDTGSEMILDQTTVKNNSTTAGPGGAIYAGSQATVTVSNGSQLIDNTASARGGGISCQGGGRATVTDSEVSSNTASFGTAFHAKGSAAIIDVSDSEINGSCDEHNGGHINDDGGNSGSGCL